MKSPLDRTAFDAVLGYADGLWPNLGISLSLFLSVVFSWERPFFTSVLLGAILIFQIVYKRQPGDLAAILAAALLGTPAEIVEVYLGEWTYHGPNLLFGVPMWIPLIWSNLFVLFRRLARSLLVIFWPSLPDAGMKPRRLVREVLLAFVGSVFLAVICFMNKLPVVYGLYLLMMITMLLFWRKDSDLLVFVVGASLGTFGEFVCVQLGFWHYYKPFFAHFGVDITLPVDWGLSAVIICRIARLWEPKKID